MTDYTVSKPRANLAGIIRQTIRRAREGHLPVSRQLVEMLILRIIHGLGPGHYHVARFWRRELSWQFKAGFWTYKKFRKFVQTLNPVEYQKLSQHKVSEKALLQLCSVPTPVFLGRMHTQLGVTAGGMPLRDGSDLENFLLSSPEITQVCFKLVEGYGGTGFTAINVDRGPTLSLELLGSGFRVSAHDFVSSILKLDSGTDYIVEQYIQQHPELARFNASSVNTLRIWALSQAGEHTILGAFLRVGRQGSLVDNTSQGALAFPVDINSGMIGLGLIKSIENETFERHKDSGEVISGSTLPYWQESAKLAIRAVEAIPKLQFAGVDVAITVDGPVVIELNVEPDPTSAIIFDQSHDDIFASHSQ